MKKSQRGTTRGRRREVSLQSSKTIALAKSFNASVRVCETSVSRAAHTQEHMANQSLRAAALSPPTTAPHLATQHKTSFVSRTAECEPPPPRCTPLPRLSTKRLPGQQSRLRGFIKLSFARLYCPTEGPCKHSVGLPQLLIHGYLSVLYHRLSEV